MGAGAGTLFRFAVGSEVYVVAGDARSGRCRAEGRAAGGAVRQGDIHLHGACVLPAIAGGSAGGGAVVCEFGQWGVGCRWSLVVRRWQANGSHTAQVGPAKAGPSLRSG